MSSPRLRIFLKHPRAPIGRDRLRREDGAVRSPERVSAREGFESLTGSLVRATARDPPPACRRRPVRRIAPQRAQRRLDALRLRIERQRDPCAERLDAAAVERMVAPERHDEQRDAVSERPQDGSEAAMGDDDPALGQQPIVVAEGQDLNRSGTWTVSRPIAGPSVSVGRRSSSATAADSRSISAAWPP